MLSSKVCVSALLNGLVAALICQLGDSHYRTRERAHAALHALAPLAYVQLEHATRHHDAEIAHRAARLYQPYREMKCARVAAGLCKTPPPWIYLECSYEMHGWIEKAEIAGADKGGPSWTNYRIATLLWATQQLLDGRPVTEIQARLEMMASEERRWKMAYAPPPP